MLDAINKANLIISGSIEPGPRDAKMVQTTLDALIIILQDEAVAGAGWRPSQTPLKRIASPRCWSAAKARPAPERETAGNDGAGRVYGSEDRNLLSSIRLGPARSPAHAPILHQLPRQ